MRFNRLKNDWMLFTSVILFVISLGFLFFVLNKSKVFVPKDFFEARAKGADISDSIVKLSLESTANLSEISRLDQSKNYNDGLDLVLQEISRNSEVKKDALSLSGELENMAARVPDIKPKEASDEAVQAITAESQIIQKLINYNDYVYGLLAMLRSRFSNGKQARTEVVVSFIAEMNAEIASINDLNNQYKDLMSKFDLLTRSAGM